MPSGKIIAAAVDPAFCQRVAFLALRTAHAIATDTPDDIDRLLYAQQVFRGDDKTVLLVYHVVAASEEIAGALESGDDQGVTDEMIMEALEQVWTARATAYAAANVQGRRVVELINQVNAMANEIENMRK